jgi:hypothetical protein
VRVLLARARGQRLFQRQSEPFQRTHVDEVADLRAAEQRAELVRENLPGGIDPNDTMRGLFPCDLLGMLEDEIYDDRFVAA